MGETLSSIQLTEAKLNVARWMRTINSPSFNRETELAKMETTLKALEGQTGPVVENVRTKIEGFRAQLTGAAPEAGQQAVEPPPTPEPLPTSVEPNEARPVATPAVDMNIKLQEKELPLPLTTLREVNLALIKLEEKFEAQGLNKSEANAEAVRIMNALDRLPSRFGQYEAVDLFTRAQTIDRLTRPTAEVSAATLPQTDPIPTVVATPLSAAAEQVQVIKDSTASIEPSSMVQGGVLPPENAPGMPTLPDAMTIPEIDEVEPPVDSKKAELIQNYLAAEATVGKLREKLSSRELSKEQFEAEMKKTLVLDENGVWWSLGGKTDSWYKYDAESKKWTQEEPPALVNKNVDAGDDFDFEKEFGKTDWASEAMLISTEPIEPTFDEPEVEEEKPSDSLGEVEDDMAEDAADPKDEAEFAELPTRPPVASHDEHEEDHHGDGHHTDHHEDASPAEREKTEGRWKIWDGIRTKIDEALGKKHADPVLAETNPNYVDPAKKNVEPTVVGGHDFNVDPRVEGEPVPDHLQVAGPDQVVPYVDPSITDDTASNFAVERSGAQVGAIKSLDAMLDGEAGDAGAAKPQDTPKKKKDAGGTDSRLTI